MALDKETLYTLRTTVVTLRNLSVEAAEGEQIARAEWHTLLHIFTELLDILLQAT